MTFRNAHGLIFSLTSILTFAPALQVRAQEIYLSGYTTDSLSLQALAYVNISVARRVVAASNHFGFFNLTCSERDTVVFTRLGYKPFILVPERTSWDLRIFLAETVKVLQGVTIYDRFSIHGHDQIQKSVKEGAARTSSPLRNFTLDPQNQNSLVQTFGPSVTLGAPWNRFVKSEREKRKLSGIRVESELTHVYREFIHSPQVKQYVMRLFGLTEEEYLKRLEAFIGANPETQYLHARTEIVNQVVAFFATKKDP